MRTALLAGLVAGSALLHAPAAQAGEGSELRGLRPPSNALRADGERKEGAGTEGLKWGAVDALDRLAPRLSLYGGTLETRRFNANNLRFSTARYRPLSQPSIELSQSSRNPLHDALPKYTLYNQVTRALPGGWGLSFGVRQSEYNFASANLLSLSAERYFGNFRSAYTLYSSRADGSALGSAHRFQLDYLYGERNTVGLAYTTGRDIDHPGLGIGLQSNDVRDLMLSGRHWLSPNWAVTYDVLSQEQGTLIKRQGLRLGVSRSF